MSTKFKPGDLVVCVDQPDQYYYTNQYTICEVVNIDPVPNRIEIKIRWVSKRHPDYIYAHQQIQEKNTYFVEEKNFRPYGGRYSIEDLERGRNPSYIPEPMQEIQVMRDINPSDGSFPCHCDMNELMRFGCPATHGKTCRTGDAS